MIRRLGIALAPQPPVVWPPDDTEESVVGTNLHQTTITNLRLGLNEAAARQALSGGAIPWQASGQMIITGFHRPDGSRYQTLPDVFVYRQPFDALRSSFAIEVDGPPMLIIEVLSPSTYGSDLDLLRGKGFSYARAGVQEYLTLDPTGERLPEQGRGWRLVAGVYQPWRSNAVGQWLSQEIGVAIGMEGALVTVRAPDGHRLLREGEIERELARRDAELASLRRRLEQLERGN